METMSQLFHNLTTFDKPLNFIANIGTIMGWVFAVYFLLIRKWMKHSKRKKFLKFTPSSEGSVAISIGVGVNPGKHVTDFLNTNFPDVPLVMTYSKLGDFSNEELLQIFEEIKSNFFDLMQKGDIKEILLFYGGPVTLMAPIGAIVDNWVPAKLFGRNNKGEYVFHFTLDRGLIKKIPSKYREKLI